MRMESCGYERRHTVKMLDVLKDVNIDNDEVGWYESCLTSAMCTREFREYSTIISKTFR